MKIWKIDKNVNDYAGFFLKNDSEKIVLEDIFDKGQYIDEWPVLELRSSDTDKPFGDCIHLWSGGNPLIFSEKVKKIVSKKYNKYIQFLPLSYRECNKIYYLINILNIVDCIDYDKSDLKVFLGKYIVDVNKYVFKESIKNIPIFKIYLDGVIKRTDSFVNDEFKKVIEDSGLEGFKFTEVYDFKG